MHSQKCPECHGYFRNLGRHRGSLRCQIARAVKELDGMQRVSDVHISRILRSLRLTERRAIDYFFCARPRKFVIFYATFAPAEIVSFCELLQEKRTLKKDLVEKFVNASQEEREAMRVFYSLL